MLNWNLVDFPLHSVYYTSDILDILISGARISSKVLPLEGIFLEVGYSWHRPQADQSKTGIPAKFFSASKS